MAIFCLHGKEFFLVQRAHKRLLEKYLDAGTRAFNLTVFSAAALALADFEEACQSLPMIAAWRVVLVHDAERLGRPLQDWLVTYLDSPNPTTCLVLVFATFDRRQNWVKKLADCAECQEHRPLYERELGPFILSEAKDLGLALDQGAVCLLIDHCGHDLAAIMDTLTRLSILLGPTGATVKERVGSVATLSQAQLEDVVVGPAARDVFDLTRALGSMTLGSVTLGERRLIRALKILGNLLDRKEAPLRIMALVARHWRLLAHCQFLSQSPRHEIARAIGVAPFFVEEYIQQARHYSPLELKHILSSLLTLDHELKSSRVAQDQQITRWFLSLCRTGRA